jgi:hypothetical protein
MTTEQEYQSFQDRLAGLQEEVTRRLSSDLISNPQLAEALIKQIDEMRDAVVSADERTNPPPDKGLAQLVGIGPEAATQFGQTRIPQGVQPYDETVAAERIVAMGDLYYIYQHEKIGVFRVVQKLQELFKAGAIYLSGGPGAYSLYQFDRREVLRYTYRDRLATYRRAFGYGRGAVPKGSRANDDFHALFSHFANQVSLFWRDKRISDVIRDRAYDPSFGSIAIVRRAGLDLRNNLKFTSYGHINVLRVEVMQLLDEAFRILGSDDVKRLVGADTAWDVIEIILTQYFNELPVSSPRQRMAVAGRELFRWVGQPHILQTERAQFETLLLEVAESAEEWITSAQSMGLAQRSNLGGVLPWDRSTLVPRAAVGGTTRGPGGRTPPRPRPAHRARPLARNGQRPRQRAERGI